MTHGRVASHVAGHSGAVGCMRAADATIWRDCVEDVRRQALLGSDPDGGRLDLASARDDRQWRGSVARWAGGRAAGCGGRGAAGDHRPADPRVAVIHLAITNLAACMALVIPVAVTIAEAANLNPVLCGLVVTLAVDAVILYPVQIAANLLAYEAGYFSTADVRKLGIGMLGLTVVVVLLVLPYWSLLSVPLRVAS